MPPRPTAKDYWNDLVQRGGAVASTGSRYLERSRCQLTTWWNERQGGSWTDSDCQTALPQRYCEEPPRLLALEPRVLFSATPLPIDLAASGDNGTTEVVQVASVETLGDAESGHPENTSLTEIAEARPIEFVIVDPTIQNRDILIEDLQRDAASRGSELQVFLLDGDADGVDQISELLLGQKDVSAIHILSHSENDAIQLGGTWLSGDNLDGYAGAIASWSMALDSDADILIYGCDLAETQAGRDLVDSIAALTDADVAASDNATGHADYGGDWLLEYQVGAIDASWTVSDATQDAWRGKLNIHTVTTTSDIVDVGDGLLSLREAITLSNVNGGGDTIILSSETYTRQMTVQNDDANVSGDFDILFDVTIIGKGSGQTTITSGYNERVFDVHGGTLRLIDLTVAEGSSTEGAGVRVDSSATLQADRVDFRDHVGVDGAAIHNAGTTYLTDVEIFNSGDGSADKGGGLLNNGTAYLNRVTFAGNTADRGGAIYNDNGPTLLDLIECYRQREHSDRPSWWSVQQKPRHKHHEFDVHIERRRQSTLLASAIIPERSICSIRSSAATQHHRMQISGATSIVLVNNLIGTTEGN